MIQSILDFILELRIQRATKAFVREKDKVRQRAKMVRMTDLINRRSPGQVRRMEVKRGLV